MKIFLEEGVIGGDAGDAKFACEVQPRVVRDEGRMYVHEIE